MPKELQLQILGDFRGLPQHVLGTELEDFGLILPGQGDDRPELIFGQPARHHSSVGRQSVHRLARPAPIVPEEAVRRRQMRI